MRDTPYAKELRSSTDSVGQTIERLYVKEYGREEIRFSWWKDGRLVARPLDLPEDELLPLMTAAMTEGVFSGKFLLGLQAALAEHLENAALIRAARARKPSLVQAAERQTGYNTGPAEVMRARRRMTAEEMLAVGREIAAMPLLDHRSASEIMDDLDPL